MQDTTVKCAGPRALFMLMSDEYIKSVTQRILDHRTRVSPESKRKFQNELDKLNLRIPGFRNASVVLRSSPHLLKDPVQHSLTISDGLAGAALRIWAESHPDLRKAVTERIEDIGTYISVSAEYPNRSDSVLEGHWPTEPWERELARLVHIHEDCEDVDEDDIKLMLCCISGRLPAVDGADEEPDSTAEDTERRPAILELLESCVADLESLSASSSEWESDIPALAENINRIVSAKLEERSRAETLDALIASVREDFASELSYLESNIESWAAANLQSDTRIADALRLSEELRTVLSDYRAIRESPMPDTRSAERERRNRNDELEDRTLDLLGKIGRLMSENLTPDDDPPSKPVHPENSPEAANVPPTETDDTRRDDESLLSSNPQTFPDFDLDQLAHENSSLKQKNETLCRENENLRAENGRLEGENENLRSENRASANDVQFLQADKSEIERNVEALQSRLDAKESEAESWRRAYEEGAKVPRMTVEDVPMHIDDVDDAVRYAQDMFPDTLLLKPNSKSQVRDNPFVKPEDVWEALKWLATSYRDAKAGISSVTDFNQSVKEACGWEYKSGQHETTMNKYRDWYTVKANGKTYRLAEHLAKGASKDARHTIRIAFDWDKDENTVVVGFIGQHQESDAT